MNDAVTYFWIVAAVAVLLVDLLAIVSVFRSDKPDRTKVLWAVAIVLLPVLGLVVWGVSGPRGMKRGAQPSSPEHSKG